MKRHIATLLAGTAATVAGGLRLIHELVRREEVEPYVTGSESNGSGPDASANGAGGHGTAVTDAEPGAPRGQKTSTAPAAPSSTVTEPAGSAASATKPTPARRDLSRSSKAELYGLATEMKITGRSGMSKAELIKAIETASTA